MKIYEIWHDGYDGCDVTHSYWFVQQTADETAARLNQEQPQKTFDWEVVEHQINDLPPKNP